MHSDKSSPQQHEISRRVQTPFLDGWKEIATYLGKSVRTVQRYECELDMPVRRFGDKVHGPVVTTKAEIDAWIRAIPLSGQSQLAAPKDSQIEVGTNVPNNLVIMRNLCEQLRALLSEQNMSCIQIRERISRLLRDLDQCDPN